MAFNPPEGLAPSQDAHAVAQLEAQLESDDEWQRKDAAKNLIALGWQPRDERQRAFLAVALGRWDQLAALGSAACEALEKALRCSFVVTTSEAGSAKLVEGAEMAATTLAHIGGEMAVECLARGIKHKDDLARDLILKCVEPVLPPDAMSSLVQGIDMAHRDSWRQQLEALNLPLGLLELQGFIAHAKAQSVLASLIVCVLFGLIGAGLFVTGLVIISAWRAEPVNPLQGAFISAVGLALAVVGRRGMKMLLRVKGINAYLFHRGLVTVRAGRMDVYRWADVTAIRLVTSKGLLAEVFGVSHVIAISCRDGRYLELTDYTGAKKLFENFNYGIRKLLPDGVVRCEGLG